MTNIRAAALVCLLIVPIAPAEELPQATPAEVGLSAENLDKAKAVMQGMVDKQKTAGAICLVARHGKLVRVDCVGKMSASGSEPMRPDAIFRVYSMTKPITSVAALILCDEGKLKLDEPVSTYLPEFKGLRVHAGKGDETVPCVREMTVRDLMRHTSGLTYGFIDDAPVDLMYRTNKIGNGFETLAEMITKLGNCRSSTSRARASTTAFRPMCSEG
jgi:CubicO group peptidase (beta-lactamase class C family)